MIRYSLVCDSEHEFEAWFASSSAFDAQTMRRQVLCPQCGSNDVAKGIMAPNISSRSQPGGRANGQEVASGPDMPAMIRKFREHVERNSENVGERFAEEARKIHFEETEPRGIYGSATGEEAEKLREEGVEFHPLPTLPEEQN